MYLEMHIIKKFMTRQIMIAYWDMKMEMREERERERERAIRLLFVVNCVV